MNPKISVILPVFNCEAHIVESIASILNQTFVQFELIIIDDCSKDKTVEIIKKNSDKRIFLHQKIKNTGYTDSLNWGIKIAQGKYIARMDADDICHPERLEKQYNYLENNSEILVCGTNAQIIGKDFCFNYPERHAEIMINLLFGSSLIHPSVMGQRKVFQENPYDRTKEPAEDYDLWVRLTAKGKLANLKDVLLYYRVHDKQISNAQKYKQEKSARESQLAMFKKLDYDRDKYSDSLVKNAIWPHLNINKSDFKKSLLWFNEIMDSQQKFDRKLLRKALSRKQYNFLKFYVEHKELGDLKGIINGIFFKKFPLKAIKFFKNK